MLILKNSDAGFMIAPEFTSDGQKYLGILRVKIRYKAGDNDTMFLPFSPNNGIKLLEDFGRETSYKKTLRAQTPEGIGNIPSYQNQIPELDTIQSSAMNSSIFSTTVNNSNNIGDLDAAFSPNMEHIRIMIEPMVSIMPRNSKLIDPLTYD